MVLRPVYDSSVSDQRPNMQYPTSESPQPGQENWQAPPSGSGYLGYPPPQGSPPYPAQSPYTPSGPYASSGGENASYYGNPQQPPAYRPNWSDNQYNDNNSPSGPHDASFYQRPYQPPLQGPYGYEHPGANPFGQPPSVTPESAGYGAPEVKQEEGVVPPSSGPQTDEERGLMGALAGAAAGGYAGHKMHHGFLGTIGGAYAGHKLEDAYKDHKKHSKPPSPAPPIAHPPPAHNQHALRRGNFSASSTDMTLDRDHDLIASCTNIRGHKKLSSISLNNAITNDDGHFKWVNPGSGPGNFAASARDVRLVDGGKVLEAELRCCNGSWRRDAIRLDERIENNDGDLRMI